MTELEELLALPTGVALRQDLMARLARMNQRLRMQIAAGMPRDEYADCQALADAVSAAHDVLCARAELASKEGVTSTG